MKSKLTRKLMAYFILILLGFALISASLFLYLGKKTLEENYTSFLLNRVSAVANSISNNQEIFTAKEEIQGPLRLEKGPKRGKEKVPGPGYIKWLNEALGNEIWIIDKEFNGIEVGKNRKSIDFAQLSSEQEKIILKSLQGQSLTSREFQSYFNETIQTVSSPIINSKGEIMGVVLLHANLDSMDGFASSALMVFFLSSLIAIISALGLSFLFAKRFIRPLKILDQQAKELIRGNYDHQVHIYQDDEIGALAGNMNKLSKRLESSRKENQNLEELRRDFISNISHELKTPVTVMKSSVEALSFGIVEENEKAKYYSVLLEESLVLERLIQDLMELTVLQNTNFSIGKKELNLVNVLRDAIRSQRMIAKEKEVEIISQIQDSFLPFTGDYTRLRQMFIVVINNGIKFSKESSSLFVRQMTNRQDYIVEVENFGEPIKEIDLDRIFYSFYQNKKNREKGFGLGLAIAKEIANRHKIEIQVESNKEATLFRFIFPK